MSSNKYIIRCFVDDNQNLWGRNINGITITSPHKIKDLYEDLKSDLDLVLERAKKMGVCRFICVGTNLKDSAQSIKLAKQYDPIYATVGIHPHDAKDFNLSCLDELYTLINNEKTV